MLSMTLPALGSALAETSKMSGMGRGWSPVHFPKPLRSAVSPRLPPMYLRYQSRAWETSGTARWMESKGGASYCARAGVHTPVTIKKSNHEAHEKREGHEKPYAIFVIFEVFVFSWLISISSVAAWRRACEFEDLIVVRVERVTAPTGEHQVTADDEQLSVVRGDVDAASRRRHGGEAEPIVGPLIYPL